MTSSIASSRPRLVAAALAIGLGAGCEAETALRTRPERTVAVFMTGQGAAEAATADTVAARLVALATRVEALHLVAGADLSRRIKRDPAAAIRACGAALHCIAALGREVGAEEVLFGRAKRSGEQVSLQFLVASPDQKQLGGRVQIKIESLGGLDAALSERFFDLFGVALPEAGALEPTIPEKLSPVARCAGVDGEVRVRRAATLTWDALTKGDALYSGDLVDTSRDGAAEIEYVSGSRFEVAPASLIAVYEPTEAEDHPEKVEKISLRAGTIRGQVAPSQHRIRVRAPDGEETELAQVPGSGELAFRVGVRANKVMEVAVRQGKGQLTTKKGSRVTLAAGKAQDVKWGELSGEVLALPDYPRLLSPGVDATVMFTTGLKINMRWKPIAVAVKYHVQVADDQSFTSLEVNGRTTQASWSFAPPIPGTYHWRVAAIDKRSREGEFGFMRRVILTPEKVEDLLVSPVDRATVSLAEQNLRFVTFAWKAPVPPGPYLFVVSREVDLLDRKPVITVSTAAQEVMTRQLVPGDYYWGTFVKREGRPRPIFKYPRRITIVE